MYGLGLEFDLHTMTVRSRSRTGDEQNNSERSSRTGRGCGCCCSRGSLTLTAKRYFGCRTASSAGQHNSVVERPEHRYRRATSNRAGGASPAYIAPSAHGHVVVRSRSCLVFFSHGGCVRGVS
jgi:hypothetical protein